MTRPHTPAPLGIIEYTDPLCPWAWEAEPVFRRLRAALPCSAPVGPVVWRRVYGILFDHDDPGFPRRTPSRAYRSLTEPEHRVLAGGTWPPPGAVRVDTGKGPLRLHPEGAAAHPATRPSGPAGSVRGR